VVVTPPVTTNPAAVQVPTLGVVQGVYTTGVVVEVVEVTETEAPTA
jgi:hypothetical protein